VTVLLNRKDNVRKPLISVSFNVHWLLRELCAYDRRRSIIQL